MNPHGVHRIFTTDTTLGGYAERLAEAITNARRFNLIECSEEIRETKPEWMKRASDLPENKAEWANFALATLKEMNGGSYPADFIASGASHAAEYLRRVHGRESELKYMKGTLPAPLIPPAKNAEITGAGNAFLDAWKKRF